MTSGPDGRRPIQGSTAPGWYTAPDNPVMVRFWDGEMWTESLRPAPNSGVGTGNRVIKDHYVQTSAVVQANLEGESIQAGFRGTAPSGRKTFAVATETRILFLFMRFIRSSKLKRVESIRYDDITAIGMTRSNTYGVGVAISSADQSFELFGSPALEGFVSYVETRLLGEDDQVDVRALPAPGQSATTADDDEAVAPIPPPASSAHVGVADEIRKLADLRDDGLLTDDEFAQQKRRLLGLD